MSNNKDSKLTSEDITRILRSNEFSKEIESYYGDDISPLAVKYYDSNQLAANKPMEDVRVEASCDKDQNGLLFGIFDGHGGSRCAQIVASRLFHYISACLTCPSNAPNKRYDSNVEFLNDDPPQEYFGENFSLLIDDLLQRDVPMQSEDALKYSFTRLDDDISYEILRQLDKPYSGRADVSGSVAVVAHIKNLDLHVAGAGDCEAVLGTFTEADGWLSKKMNSNHDCDNEEEWKRIMSEHPSEQQDDLFAMGRLLGGIQPFRGFGDYCYKWNKENVARFYARQCQIFFPRRYQTPPYLTALPDVFHHRLTANDKFLILASDGLWEKLTPFEAVWLVGEHMRRKNGHGPLKRRKLKKNRDMRLVKMLESFDKRSVDENAATHLLRYALGCNYDGEYDEDELAKSLSKKRGIRARLSRDDITITVIYMNADFFKKTSSIINRLQL